MDLIIVLAIAGIVLLLIVIILAYVNIISICLDANGARRLRRSRDSVYALKPDAALRVSTSTATADTAVYAKTARNFVHADSFLIDIN